MSLIPARGRTFGRIPIANISPVLEDGGYPAKAVVGEAVEISANIFREGHDAVGAAVVLTAPDGRRLTTEMAQIEPIGLDIFSAWVRPDAMGAWTFRIEAYSDRWATWQHNAGIKIPAGIDVELMCAEGSALVGEALVQAQAARDSGAVQVLQAAAKLLDAGHGADGSADASAADEPDAADPGAAAATGPDADELVRLVHDPELDAAMRAHCPRALVTPTADYPIQVSRKLAQFASWYEFFPRSYGASQNPDGSWHSGSFTSSLPMLERIAGLGFDVVYLPPIHPIGEQFRKGRNNSLEPDANDPGSPWAIGNAEGGHDAIHPDLGTLDDFDHFVARARQLGLEVALDFALQASPDHPWVQTHPEFFTKRLNGTIAYAENPPKKYQDIYPINFDNDPPAIYQESLRILQFWIEHGVTIFRVDNPHTKPVDFWAWLLGQVHSTHPEVIFLAEAFTRPAMMAALGMAGFDEGYSYFTWRNTRKELETYLRELVASAAYYRPNFFVNTPDINPFFLQSGKQSAFAIRAILATTMSPAWGMYSGFELMEHAVFKPGGEEYLDSEKYEYRPRDYDAQPNLNALIGRLNQIRQQHPALQQIRRTQVHWSTSDRLFVFSKSDRDDTVIVVCSLDPDNAVEAEVGLDLTALGPLRDRFMVHDELSGADFEWGERNYARLTPDQPAHILHVRG